MGGQCSSTVSEVAVWSARAPGEWVVLQLASLLQKWPYGVRELPKSGLSYTSLHCYRSGRMECESSRRVGCPTPRFTVTEVAVWSARAPEEWVVLHLASLLQKWPYGVRELPKRGLSYTSLHFYRSGRMECESSRRVGCPTPRFTVTEVAVWSARAPEEWVVLHLASLLQKWSYGVRELPKSGLSYTSLHCYRNGRMECESSRRVGCPTPRFTVTEVAVWSARAPEEWVVLHLTSLLQKWPYGVRELPKSGLSYISLHSYRSGRMECESSRRVGCPTPRFTVTEVAVWSARAPEEWVVLHLASLLQKWPYGARELPKSGLSYTSLHCYRSGRMECESSRRVGCPTPRFTLTEVAVWSARAPEEWVVLHLASLLQKWPYGVRELPKSGLSYTSLHCYRSGRMECESSRRVGCPTPRFTVTEVAVWSARSPEEWVVLHLASLKPTPSSHI